ncbi:MAG: hypothetical protein ACQGQO_04665 [Sphaerochaetaceae bacterium]
MNVEIVKLRGETYALVPYEQFNTLCKSGDLVDRKYIREKLGISPQNLTKQPWLLPDFGVNAPKGKQWTRVEVDMWLAIGRKELRQRYRHKQLMEEIEMKNKISKEEIDGKH